MNNWADLYNDPATGASVPTVATAAAGPNQSIVTGAGNNVGAGAPAGSAAVWLLGMALALVLLRVFISMGGRVA